MSEALSTTVPIIKIQRYFTTVDMERFTGLKIRSFSLIKFFAVVLSQCIGHQTKKVCGPKGNGLYVLQVCVFPLISILHHLLSQLLNNGIVPTEWKLHAITHVFKSCDMSNVKNYVLYYLSVEQYL